MIHGTVVVKYKNKQIKYQFIFSRAVSVMSSHTYVIDKAVGGVPIGMSQMVANMLETLLKMWKLHTPPEYVCTSYVV